MPARRGPPRVEAGLPQVHRLLEVPRPLESQRRPLQARPRSSNQERRPAPAGQARARQVAGPRRPPAAAPPLELEVTRPQGRRTKLKARPTKAPAGRQALRSWGRPTKTRRPARSTMAPAAPLAERLLVAFPNQWRPDQTGRPAAQRPTTARAAPIHRLKVPRVPPTLPGAIPMLARRRRGQEPVPPVAAVGLALAPVAQRQPLREVVAAGEVVAARQAAARPRSEQVEQPLRPSSRRLAAAEAVELKRVEGEAPPTSAPPAASGRLRRALQGLELARPRSARPERSRQGPGRRARVAQPAPAAERRETPRSPGRTWPVTRPADPSSATPLAGL